MTPIEIEITVLGNLVNEFSSVIDHGFFDREMANIREQFAGMICTEHIRFVVIDKKYIDGRYVAELSGCCDPLMQQIENRLNEIYHQ